MLAGKHILVVEDEYMIAWDLVDRLQKLGAAVDGPAPSVAEAIALISRCSPDAALLDINLGDELAFDVADKLQELKIPFVFTTGYDATALSPRYRTVPRFEKPVDVAAIAATLTAAITQRTQA
jgi:DNA-binding response OmpR family regulator